MARRMTESLTVSEMVVLVVFDDREGAGLETQCGRSNRKASRQQVRWLARVFLASLVFIADQPEMRRWPAGVNCIADIV